MPHHQTPDTAIPTKTHTSPPTTHQGVTSQVGGCEPQLRIHIGAALNVGLTREEIVEAILHLTHDALVPWGL